MRRKNFWYTLWMAGLYVHIPFCIKKCHYCNFVITTGSDKSDFLDIFKKEAAHYRDFFKNKNFETLYLGGGTPSTLDPDETKTLFSALREKFSLGQAAEITFEVNPADVTEKKAEAWHQLGVNR